MDEKNSNPFVYYLKRLPFVFRIIFGPYPAKLEKMNYENYWIARGPFGFSTRYPVFARLIEEGSTVFDIGCGDGSTLKFLQKQKNIKGTGIDISQEAVKMAKDSGIEAYAADASSPTFNISGEYDYIIISEVLEHIPNPEDLMEKVKGKFKKGLIVSVPNIGHYIHRLRLLFGRFPLQWAYHPGEHLRFWTVKDFTQWVGELGFKICDRRTHTGFLFLHRYMPNLFADTVVYLLKEVEL